jgi:hypothetical protein
MSMEVQLPPIVGGLFFCLRCREGLSPCFRCRGRLSACLRCRGGLSTVRVGKTIIDEIPTMAASAESIEGMCVCVFVLEIGLMHSDPLQTCRGLNSKATA